MSNQEEQSNQQPQQVRTASEVIVSLEQKVNQLLYICQSQDFNLKIMSNKLNQVIQTLSDLPAFDNQPGESNPYSIATAQPSFQAANFPAMKIQDQLTVPKEMGMPMETEPVGFRRTSRPETYAPTTPAKKNVPTPSIKQPEMKQAAKIIEKTPEPANASSARIPVMQRVVDANGRSVFMGEVEVINAASNITEVKTRTNGTGKYSASLVPGKYRVIVKKRESLTNQNLEATQHLTIDGSTPKELPILIMRADK